MAMKFKYQARRPEAVEKRASQQGSDFKGVFLDEYKTFRPGDGDNFVRILPPTWEDAEHFGLDLYIHYQVGPDRASVLCPSKMKKKKCPICEAKLKAEKSGDEELAKELGARHQVAVWMIDAKDKEKGPMIWSMSWTIDRDIAKICKDRETGEVYPIDHPEEGRNVQFDRTGKGILTKYGGFAVSKRPSSIDEKWLEFVVKAPLPDCLVWCTYDEIQKLFEGGEEDDAAEDKPAASKVVGKRKADPEEDAEDEAPAKPKPSTKPPKAAEAEVEEDDEEGEPEPVKPKFVPRGKAAKAAEPVEEEVEEEAEEEPEPPKKVVKKKAAPEPEPDAEDDDEEEETPIAAKAANGSAAASLKERFLNK